MQSGRGRVWDEDVIWEGGSGAEEGRRRRSIITFTLGWGVGEDDDGGREDEKQDEDEEQEPEREKNEVHGREERGGGGRRSEWGRVGRSFGMLSHQYCLDFAGS